MRLLTPDTIAEQKKYGALEVAKRTNAAAAEEARIMRKLNSTRTEADKEWAIIKEQTDTFVAAQELRRNAISDEVKSLEERRRIALEPIDIVKKQAEQLLQQANERLAVVEEKEANLLTQAEELQEAREDIVDRTTALNEQVIDLDKREKHIVAEEARQKQSGQELADKWAAYHAAVHAFNTRFTKQTQKLSAQRKANKLYKQQLDAVALTQAENERGLRDRYATLERAVEEFNEKQRNSSKP